MTGEQFRGIRRFNRITQEEICRYSKFNSRSSIYLIEKSSFVPTPLVKLLSELIDYDLLDNKVAAEYFEEIPENYKRSLARTKSRNCKEDMVIKDLDGNILPSEQFIE